MIQHFFIKLNSFLIRKLQMSEIKSKLNIQLNDQITDQNEMYDTILKIFNKLLISLLTMRESSTTAIISQKNLCQQQNFLNIMIDYSSLMTNLSNLVINYKNSNSHFLHHFCYIYFVALFYSVSLSKNSVSFLCHTQK